MKIEVVILSFPSLIVLMVSVDVKQNQKKINRAGAHELCESRGGRPGLPVPNSPDGLRGRRATLNLNSLCSEFMSCVKVEVDILGFPSPTVFLVSRHKATLNLQR